MSKNIAKTIYKALKAYSVPITYNTLEQEINSNPAYPSIRCISDVLDTWKVKHVVMNLTIEIFTQFTNSYGHSMSSNITTQSR